MTNIVDKKKYYTPTEIFNLALFPWINNEKSIRDFISQDVTGKNILKTVVKKTSDEEKGKHGIRYFVPGANIIKLLKKFEEGKLFK